MWGSAFRVQFSDFRPRVYGAIWNIDPGSMLDHPGLIRI